jgi:type II secretory pathway component GspD/PulD (secretin)
MNARHVAVTVMVCITASVLVGETSVKTEIKINAPAGEASVQGMPLGSAEAFTEGKLFYNAIPSTPAAGTAVRVIDSVDDKDYITKVYTLKTQGISSELASYLRTSAALEGGRVDVSVNADTGVEYILVTAPLFQFPYFDGIVNALDQPGTEFYEDGTSIGSYTMRNRLASDIATFVNDALQSKDGLVYADDTVNKLYLIDSPSYYNATIGYIEQFDVAPEMVRIDMEIVEIEMDDDFNFGLALEAWKEGLPEEVNMSFNFEQAQDNANFNPEGWAKYAAQSLDLNGMRPKAMANVINYLVRTGKAKVLSRPTVVALNGQVATIQSVDKVSYRAYSAADEPLNQQDDVGISLEITPTIGQQTISLGIKASVNSLVGYTSASTPIINSRSTVANVVLQDGELFTLSGLRKDTITKMDERVPILGWTPLVGYLFRHEIDVKTTSEIVVLLTPRKVTASSGVLAQERELLQKTRDEAEAPQRAPVDKFIDRVILNKLP